MGSQCCCRRHLLLGFLQDRGFCLSLSRGPRRKSRSLRVLFLPLDPGPQRSPREPTCQREVRSASRPKTFIVNFKWNPDTNDTEKRNVLDTETLIPEDRPVVTALLGPRGLAWDPPSGSSGRREHRDAARAQQARLGSQGRAASQGGRQQYG